jgi:competence protein ComEA
MPAVVFGGWLPPVVEERQPMRHPRPEESPESDSSEATRSWRVHDLRGGARWDPGRHGVLALVAVAVCAAVVAGVVLLRARPHEVAPPPLLTASAAPVTGGPQVVVDVAGKVRHPGIVRLPLGSRVDDAVRAAGGPLPGAGFEGLNRARKLADGEQVLVGAPAAAAGAAVGGDGRVDLNAADVTALDALPGIGPVLAQKIVDWRTEHGRFTSADQLREVGGIGESKYAAVKNKVRT